MYDGRQDAADTKGEYRGLIIKFEPKARIDAKENAGGFVSTGLPEVDRLNARWGVTRVDRIVRAGQLNPGHPFAQYYVIEAAGSADYEEMKSEYAQLGSVEMVELDYVFEYTEAPNDPLFQYQVNLYNTGQLHPIVVKVDGDYNDYVDWVSGTAGADINAYGVLSSPPDNTSTAIVAIIDSGVDLDHPDMVGRIWTNIHEVADNGLDDDRNGYIDDVVGWDFNGEASDNDPTDELGHGSHCAGIAAGVINNGIGIAGVCPDVKVMALRTELATSDLVGAIVYAVDNGADVISMSWGGFYYPVSLSDALVYAKSRGLVLCASAGNFGMRAITYPAFAYQTISVGASTDEDEVASFSTYNYRVDLVAPGVDIISLRADDLDLYGTEGGSSGIEPGVHIIDDYYYLMSGTSMSSPTVAGVAACLKSISSGLSPDKTKEILIQTADDFLDPNGTGAYLPGWDEYSGWGRVNMGEALAITPDVKCEIQSPSANQNLAEPSISITGSAGGADFTFYRLEYGEGWNPTEWTEIVSSGIPVTEGLLGTWSVGSLLGHYTLRLQVGYDHYDMVTVFVGSDLTADMTSPAEDDTLSGFTRVNGTVYGSAVTQWVLDYQPSTGGPDWTELANSAQPHDDDLMHLWNTNGLAVGSYVLRFSVYSGAGLEVQQEATVHKIPTRDPDWITDLGNYVTRGPNYGDFDGDGIKEIIIGISSGIKVINADGTAKTTGLPTFPTGDFRSQIAVGNLDGDGIDDIVAVRFDVPGVYGFPSSGDDFVIPFSSSYVYTPLAAQEFRWLYVMLEDADYDGIDEMYLHCGSVSAHVIIPLKVGDVAVSQIWTGMTEFVAADLNGDGLSERYGLRYSEGSIQQLDENGGVLDEYIPSDIPDAEFWGSGISAYDIDDDGILELIVSGHFLPAGGTYVGEMVSDVMVYAFDEGLELVAGWPHHTGIWSEYAFHPVLGDIDGDGLVEYFLTVDDISAGQVIGLHVDGTPYDFDTGDRPLIDSACLTPPMLTDINGDGQSEILAGYSVRNRYGMGYINGIAAWDANGHMLPGFPLAYEPESDICGTIMPMLGDIDDDGKVDLAVPIFNKSLAFFEFDAGFDTAASPAVMWHYNQSLNAVGPSFWTPGGYQCGDANGDGEVEPVDAVYLISWLWNSGPPPVAVNVDGLGGVDPLDAVYFVNWMWRGGPDLQCP